MQPGTATAAFADSTVFCYNSFLGMPLARQAVAYFLTRRFLHPNNPHPPPDDTGNIVQYQHVAIGSGAASLLHQTFLLLGEAGDACLIPAPYYAAFDNDMNLVAKIVPIGIIQENPVRGPTELELEQAYEVAKSVCCVHVENPFEFVSLQCNSLCFLVRTERLSSPVYPLDQPAQSTRYDLQARNDPAHH